MFIEAANYLTEVIGNDFKTMYRFVINYPGMNKEEILMKYLEN